MAPPTNAGLLPPQSGILPPQSGGYPTQSGILPPQSGNIPPQPGGPPRTGILPSGAVPPGQMPGGPLPPPPGNSQLNSGPIQNGIPPLQHNLSQPQRSNQFPPVQSNSLQQPSPLHQNQPNMVNQMNNMNINPNYFPSPSHTQHQHHETQQVYDVLREKNVVPADGWDVNEPDMSFTHRIGGRHLSEYPRENCSTQIMRSTLNACPETTQLLKKTKLPFGLLCWPFKDVQQLSIVTTHKEIVRCARCRTYINPFCSILDQMRWRCNLCLRTNDIPQHFLQYLGSKDGDKQGHYGHPEQRPEVLSSTIEYIAPPQYTTRAPPPVRYLYLLDISHSALQTGYLKAFSSRLVESLDHIMEKHDKRMQIGFIGFDSFLHFF